MEQRYRYNSEVLHYLRWSMNYEEVETWGDKGLCYCSSRAAFWDEGALFNQQTKEPRVHHFKKMLFACFGLLSILLLVLTVVAAAFLAIAWVRPLCHEQLDYYCTIREQYILVELIRKCPSPIPRSIIFFDVSFFLYYSTYIRTYSYCPNKQRVPTVRTSTGIRAVINGVSSHSRTLTTLAPCKVGNLVRTVQYY